MFRIDKKDVASYECLEGLQTFDLVNNMGVSISSYLYKVKRLWWRPMEVLIRVYIFFEWIYIINLKFFLKSEKNMNTGLMVASESFSNTYAAPCSVNPNQTGKWTLVYHWTLVYQRTELSSTKNWTFGGYRTLVYHWTLDYQGGSELSSTTEFSSTKNRQNFRLPKFFKR